MRSLLWMTTSFIMATNDFHLKKTDFPQKIEMEGTSESGLRVVGAPGVDVF